MQEVDDLAEADAIDEVADGAAEDEAECERRKSIPGGQLAEEGDDDRDGDDGDADEEDEPYVLGRVANRPNAAPGLRTWVR